MVRMYHSVLFSHGMSSPECYAIWAWTPTRVIGVREYDGSTHLVSLPRDPVAVVPDML